MAVSSVESLDDALLATGFPYNRARRKAALDIAARFWEEDRYRAFRACYRSMRAIDDLVDTRKAAGTPITDAEREHLVRQVRSWVEVVRRRADGDIHQRELIAAVERFRIPLWPWERLAEAMIYDLSYDGFDSWRVFRRYCEGAAVAPASVFMHLCGVSHGDGAYSGPAFDVRRAARPLALFSYLVHIIRDFQKDQQNHLNYFTRDLLRRHQLSTLEIRNMAESGRVTPSLRRLIAEYVGMAEHFWRRARAAIDRTASFLSDRYQLSLEILYSLYLQVFRKIDPARGSFTSRELKPTSVEMRRCIDNTIVTFQRVLAKSTGEEIRD